MLAKTTIKLEGKEYQITKEFRPDLKAQEVFWQRYFIMATDMLSDAQKEKRKKVVEYEECNSISKA